MNTKKKPTTNFLNLGNQIRIPAAICMTPIPLQTIVEILSIKEQGGSRNDKNLSAPTIIKRRLQIATTIFKIFTPFIFLISQMC